MATPSRVERGSQDDLSDLVLDPPAPANLRTHVGDTLRALLVTGKMRPGVLYSAPRLAAQFGVSATPVREAMLDLVSEGLVETVRNKGFRVTELTEAELDAMAELRALIEVPVMGMVAESCSGETAERVEELRPVAHAISKAGAAGDLVAYIEQDTAFHLRFLSLHHNDHVVEVVRHLRSRSRLYGLEGLVAAGLIVNSCEDHEQMIDAALERDGDEMRRLMTGHIARVRSVWAGRSSEQSAQ